MPNQYPFGVSELNKELKDELEIGEELGEEDFEEIRINLPTRPSFPIHIFTLALIKDISDIYSVGLLGTFTNIIAMLVIRLWLFGKVGFIQKYLYKRFIFALILEFIPFINVIPQWSFFVWKGHFKERKRIDKILESIAKLIIQRKIIKK